VQRRQESSALILQIIESEQTSHPDIANELGDVSF